MPSGKTRRSKSAAAHSDGTKTRSQAAIATHMDSQTEVTDSPSATAADLAAAMQTIATGQAALMDKIDHVQTNVDFICRDLDSFRGRMVEVEQQVSGTEDTVRDHSGDTLKARVRALENRAEDAENRNRCYYIGSSASRRAHRLHGASPQRSTPWGAILSLLYC